MNLLKLNPWNWFKYAESDTSNDSQIPIFRKDDQEIPITEVSKNPLLRFNRGMDELFGNLFNLFYIPTLRSYSPFQYFWSEKFPRIFRSRMNVSDEDNKYKITFDVPELSESELSIEVKGDVLVIKGEKEDKTERKDKGFYHMARSYGAFQRTLSLPDDADVDSIKANLNNGVLNIEITRREIDKQDVKHIPIG